MSIIGQKVAQQATDKMYRSGPTTIGQQATDGYDGLVQLLRDGDSQEKAVASASLLAARRIQTDERKTPIERAWAVQGLEKAALNHAAAGLQTGFLATIAFHAMLNIDLEAQQQKLGPHMSAEVRVGLAFADEMARQDPSLADAAHQVQETANEQWCKSTNLVEVAQARDLLFKFFDDHRGDRDL